MTRHLRLVPSDWTAEDVRDELGDEGCYADRDCELDCGRPAFLPFPLTALDVAWCGTDECFSEYVAREKVRHNGGVS